MAIDIVRLIAGSDHDLIRELLAALAPEQAARIDWTLSGRSLGSAVQESVSENAHAWVRLQQIAALARHGSKPLIRSVLYSDRALRHEFDQLGGGMETAAIWLALQSDELFEYCLSALHVDQGLNKRSWKAFRVRRSNGMTVSFEPERLRRFEGLVREAIHASPSFDSPGNLETHHFSRVVFPEQTHSRRSLEQVTVFAEARMVTEEVFVETRVQTKVRAKVDNISVLFDRERNELDVVTIGGRRFIESVAEAFFVAFSDRNPALEPLIRREINFTKLSSPFKPTLDDQSRFIRAKIDEIRVLSPGGALYTFDARKHRETDLDVYDIARKDFGNRSPFEQHGWTVVGARVILFAVPSKPHLKPKMRAVELKPNGRTNLREQDDTDRYIADELFTGWGLLARHEVQHDDD